MDSAFWKKHRVEIAELLDEQALAEEQLYRAKATIRRTNRRIRQLEHVLNAEVARRQPAIAGDPLCVSLLRDVYLASAGSS